MNQLEKIALKGKAVGMVAEMLIDEGYDVYETVEGLVVEMDGQFVAFKAVVKKDTFDLADALQEKADKDAAAVARAEDRAAKAAEKEAKAKAKADAKADKEQYPYSQASGVSIETLHLGILCVDGELTALP